MTTNTQPTNEPEKFVVNKDELGYINTKLEKLNRRALKLGLEPMVLTVLHEFNEVTHEEGVEFTTKKAEITIVGKPPKIAGWTFIATVEPIETETGDEKNLINKMPGTPVEVPVEYRTASMFQCDHCHTKRQRNEIFVIQHDNGEFRVVGRQCIKDFMGYHASPEGLVRMAQEWSNFVAEVRDGLGGGGHGEIRVNLNEFLFRAAYFVNTHGYHNSSELDAYGSSVPVTKWATFNTFDIPEKARKTDPYYGFFYNSDGTTPGNFGMGTGMQIGRKRVKTMNEEEYQAAKTLASEARAHICSLVEGDEDKLNDYLYNMKSIMQMKYIAQRHAGYAASVFVVYLKHLGKEKEITEARKSEFVGTPGDKIEFEAKLIDVRCFDGVYGPGKILFFGDANGNRYKWFTKGNTTSVPVGTLVKIKATIKKHDEYNGYKSTVITRAKLSPVEE